MMQTFPSRNFVITFLVVILFVIGGFVLANFLKKEKPLTPVKLEPKIIQEIVRTVGISVEGRKIEAYTFGEGETRLMFVGGIHGGYEWNTVLLAYQFIEYLKKNPSVVPPNITVSIIPSANPDGLYRLIKKEGSFTSQHIPTAKQALGTGRFNAHNVDLNRNFNCKWKPKSYWRDRVVDAGTKAFSEPESVAIRDFVLERSTEAVIFWHSKAGAVYASKCNAGILPKTFDIMNTYAKAAKYRAIESFDAYETSGDAEGWLASIGIPAITVELTTHEDIEWERNLAGIKALFNYYRKDLLRD